MGKAVSPQASIGIIGGSGLYQIEGLENLQEVKVDTPFGEPSDVVILGTLGNRKVAFLPRHGRGHSINPTEIPVRANIFALKSLGVEWIISITAVGSLKEKMRPMDLVVLDQLIDRTKNRVNSFFSDGLVVHAPFAEPFCPVLGDVLYEGALSVGATVHKGGVCVVMEGPLFSTRAESSLYRSWGADVIGMTALPEAKLAREAEICYSALACVTDYDCWHADYESVTADIVIENLRHNVDTSKEVLNRVIPRIPKERECACAHALEKSIITARDRVPKKIKEDLSLLVGKYLP